MSRTIPKPEARCLGERGLVGSVRDAEDVGTVGVMTTVVAICRFPTSRGYHPTCCRHAFTMGLADSDKSKRRRAALGHFRQDLYKKEERETPRTAPCRCNGVRVEISGDFLFRTPSPYTYILGDHYTSTA